VTSSVGLSDRRPPWTAAAEPVHGCTLFGVSDKATLGGAVRSHTPAGCYDPIENKQYQP